MVADANSCVYIPLKGFLGTNNAWYGGRRRKTKPHEEEGPSCEMVSSFISLSALIASSAFSMGPRETRVAFPLPYLKYAVTVLMLGLDESCSFPRTHVPAHKILNRAAGLKGIAQPSSFWSVLIHSQTTPDLLHLNSAL